MLDADYWIDALSLIAHREGGYYRESYRSSLLIPRTVLPDYYPADRVCSTAIYFLLRAGQISHLHRIHSDELWHFYTGGPVTVHIFSDEGELRSVRLGPDPTQGQQFQLTVPGRCWFGTTVDPESDFALVGCTVSPGFEYADFEMADRGEMLRRFPSHHELIDRLTKPSVDKGAP